MTGITVGSDGGHKFVSDLWRVVSCAEGAKASYAVIIASSAALLHTMRVDPFT